MTRRPLILIRWQSLPTLAAPIGLGLVLALGAAPAHAQVPLQPPPAATGTLVQPVAASAADARHGDDLDPGAGDAMAAALDDPRLSVDAAAPDPIGAAGTGGSATGPGGVELATLALPPGEGGGWTRSDAIPVPPKSPALRDDLPLWWSDGTRPLGRTVAMLDLFDRSVAHGFDPEWYQASTLRAAYQQPLTPERARDLDRQLTEMALQYIRDLGQGLVQPPELAARSALKPARVDAYGILVDAVANRTIGRLEERLAPRHPQYLALQAALADIRAQGGDGFEAVPTGRLLRPGMADAERVPVLARRMKALGYLAADADPGSLYGPELEAAVRAYQGDQGLTVDGLVGGNTLARLNKNPAEKLDTILINMERWRWMPRDLGQRHILVNIPGYYVQAVEDGDVLLEMPVVVGKPSRETPIFFSTMDLMTFHPYWHVPSSIAQRDLLPKYGTLAALSSRFKIINHKGGGYTLRQAPGPKNPLGRVRFGIKNDMAVYLHDTPTKHLFRQANRALSSGCVRVGDPLALATFVMVAEEGWTESRTASVFNDTSRASRGPLYVTLNQNLPVYLTYFTAVAEKSRKLTFYGDVYGEDALLRKAMLR